MQPPPRTKRAYWLIFALFSSVFAEVLSGSFPHIFTDAWGYIAIIPLYGLHAVFLWYVAASGGRLRFSTLFLCGVLFGLYEAYITKVLWSPNWDAAPTQFLGVYWLETSTLILWWHPFMSFIIPLFTAAALMTGGWKIWGLPPKFLKWLTSKNRSRNLLLFAVWMGIFTGSMIPFPHSAIAPLISFGVLGMCTLFWQKRNGRTYTLSELRPTKRQAKKLLAALVALYIVLSIVTDLNELPGLLPQAVILSMYAVVIFSLWKGIKKEHNRGERGRSWRFKLEFNQFAKHFAVFYVIAVFFSIIGIGFISLVIGWLVGSAIGFYCLLYSLADVLKPELNRHQG